MIQEVLEYNSHRSRATLHRGRHLGQSARGTPAREAGIGGLSRPTVLLAALVRHNAVRNDSRSRSVGRKRILQTVRGPLDPAGTATSSRTRSTVASSNRSMSRSSQRRSSGCSPIPNATRGSQTPRADTDPDGPVDGLASASEAHAGEPLPEELLHASGVVHDRCPRGARRCAGQTNRVAVQPDLRNLEFPPPGRQLRSVGA